MPKEYTNLQKLQIIYVVNSLEMNKSFVKLNLQPK